MSKVDSGGGAGATGEDGAGETWLSVSAAAVVGAASEGAGLAEGAGATARVDSAEGAGASARADEEGAKAAVGGEGPEGAKVDDARRYVRTCSMEANVTRRGREDGAAETVLGERSADRRGRALVAGVTGIAAAAGAIAVTRRASRRGETAAAEAAAVEAPAVEAAAACVWGPGRSE